jgi:type I restriction enzyme S subunit
MSKSPTLFDNLTSQNGHADVAPQSEKEYQDVKRLGRLPQDWSVRRIGECIVSLDAGTSVGGEDRQKHDGEKGILKVSAVSSGRLRPSEHKVVSPDRLDEVDTSPQEGRLIISRANTRELVGASAYVEADYSDLYLPDKLWQIQVDDRHVLPRWLHHILWTRRLRFNIGNEATGSSASMKNISQKRFKRLRIPVPPLDEQQRILNHLGTWDRVIERVDALIEQKRERLHGLRQRLLTGEVRFPEFDEPWRQKTLGDYFRYFSNRNGDEHDLPVLSCSKVHGIIRQSDKFDRRVASKDTSNYKIVERGDLVYDPMLLWDASIGFVDCVDRGLVSPAYYTFAFDEERGHRDFFRHLLATHWVEHQYEAISQGTNTRRRKAPRAAFLGIEVDVPSLPEQKKIAEVMRTAETEINTLEEKRDALQRQKKGLMQRLLTGAVRTV